MPLPMRPNHFKMDLGRRSQIGFWMTLASPMATEVASTAGFDWLLIDMEHSPNDLRDVVDHLRACACGTSEPVVRIPWNDPVTVKRMLDAGARSIMFPFVQSAQEARLAVSATRYPPRGMRGVAGGTRANRFGRVENYLHRAEEEICVIVQIETARAVGEIEAIAAVDGVDGIFIGPSDLSADLGYLGQWQHPEVRKAILDAGARVMAAGKPAGFLHSDEAELRAILDAGFSFVAVGIDTGTLARQCDALLAKYRKGAA